MSAAAAVSAPDMTDERPFRDPHPVAEWLGISVSRVYAAAQEGLIPCLRIGRAVYFEWAVLRAWRAAGGRSFPGGWRRIPHAPDPSPTASVAAARDDT